MGTITGYRNEVAHLAVPLTDVVDLDPMLD